ncbi:MAG: hypothetical protein F6K19_35400 [Cyanothece sp. SIO1E1]|nr:hypothetical protein [Cyanothece sp. SIO1E1]
MIDLFCYMVTTAGQVVSLENMCQEQSTEAPAAVAKSPLECDFGDFTLSTAANDLGQNKIEAPISCVALQDMGPTRLTMPLFDMNLEEFDPTQMLAYTENGLFLGQDSQKMGALKAGEQFELTATIYSDKTPNNEIITIAIFPVPDTSES